MTIQPKTKGAALLEEVNRLKREGQNNDFALARLRREAEALRGVDPYHAHTALGFLAGVTENVPEVRKHFDIALRIATDQHFARQNYANILRRLGFISEARGHLFQAHQLVPSDLHLLKLLIDASGSSGRFQDTQQLIETRIRLAPKEVDPDDGTALAIAEFLRGYAISDDAVEGLQLLASEVMHAAGVYSSTIAYRLLGDEESEWLSGWWQVAAPVATVVKLNEALADREAEAPSSAGDEHVTFLFVGGAPDGHHAE
jgi:tetratricopeptide (TPR) repeat protein